jgi:hypothetical protein
MRSKTNQKTPKPPRGKGKLRLKLIIMFLASFFSFFFFLSFLFFPVLGLEPRAYALSHSTGSIFLFEGFFEIGYGELFAWAGFELLSS